MLLMFEEETSCIHQQGIETICHEDVESLSVAYELHNNNQRKKESDY